MPGDLAYDICHVTSFALMIIIIYHHDLGTASRLPVEPHLLFQSTLFISMPWIIVGASQAVCAGCVLW